MMAKVGNLSRIQVLYLQIWRCLKENRSLPRAYGSKEKVYKVHVLKFGQCVESRCRSSCLFQKMWVGHPKIIFPRGAGP